MKKVNTAARIGSAHLVGGKRGQTLWRAVDLAWKSLAGRGSELDAIQVSEINPSIRSGNGFYLLP